MATAKKRENFPDTDEGRMLIAELKAMVKDGQYMTDSTYISNTDAYPNNQLPFIDKHIEYVRTHPSVDIDMYLSNLRLMTKIR